MVQQIAVPPYHGILLSSTKEQTIDAQNNSLDSQGNCVKTKIMSEKMSISNRLYVVNFHLYNTLEMAKLKIKNMAVVARCCGTEWGGDELMNMAIKG